MQVKKKNSFYIILLFHLIFIRIQSTFLSSSSLLFILILGDCGTDEMFSQLHGVTILPSTSVIELPDGLPAAYFNLSTLVGSGSITDGSHDNANLVRTATISQKFKIMTLTFHRNITK